MIQCILHNGNYCIVLDIVRTLECNETILQTQGFDLEDTQTLAPCTHEEADGRLMLHLRHCLQHGYRHVNIRSVDSDIVVLAIFTLAKLQEQLYDGMV